MRRGLGHPGRPSERQTTRSSSKPDRKEKENDAPMTVTELTRTIKTLLEGRVGTVSVTGETAGMKASPSGHVYFSLKDAGALVDCVIWRSSASRMGKLPADGSRVTLRGKLSVYEPRGRYQLVVTGIASSEGKGDLWQQFEELKNRLAEEGLFEVARKRMLPEAPKVVGIVTSPTGAALRDILKILSRRAPNVRVVVSPTPVQGDGASGQIAKALHTLDRWGGADVIIVGRGGGSIEDLWAFNGEEVARSIAAAKVPVVSAVGHETDFTIADFVADARAATPSEAAERIVPDGEQMRGRIRHVSLVLGRALGGIVRERREWLKGVGRERVFRRPEEMFNQRWQQLDETLSVLTREVKDGVGRAKAARDLAEARLSGLSPLGVLERGYAVVLNDRGGVVKDAAELKEGEGITALVHKGRIKAQVTEVKE